MTGTLPTYVVVAVIARDQGGRRLALVQQRGPTAGRLDWGLPGGKAGPGESLHQAVERELAEETGLCLVGDVSLAYVVHYFTAGVGRNAAVYVFDGESAGDLAVRDPDGDIVQAQYVEIEEAIKRLSAVPDAVVREPALAYLCGDRPAGTLWSFERRAGVAPAVITPHRP
jgi:8-oxo-dGTP pyrophosphatase MutT (NUDIX family)